MLILNFKIIIEFEMQNNERKPFYALIHFKSFIF